MRRGTGQVGRLWLGVAALLGAAALGGCGMTPRDAFFQARSITFRATPGAPASGTSGLASGSGSTGLAAAFGGTR